ncbi:enoyl-CoA hydratase-related protein [Yinghuangia sp. ASG 101]|uniref:enoyl-CoA hydratase-related protein n=1 Tax=Yinghuangia sp. ASG 101 TaxID=2896848 RepID=UPI0022B2240F|nr:enoyl-CoA hydratase-related protein [Yinghuangia sp. ASG 101]
MELGLTGDLVTAARLREMGLANLVVPASEVRASALALAERIAANGPLAVRTTKRLMAAEIPDADWDMISAAVRTIVDSEDAREGARAFIEKRTPRWVGR